MLCLTACQVRIPPGEVSPVKGTGIVRRLNELGSVSIPKEMRKKMHMEENESVEIFVGDDGEIILKKYQPGCIFCGEINDTIAHRGKRICGSCLEIVESKRDESS